MSATSRKQKKSSSSSKIKRLKQELSQAKQSLNKVKAAHKELLARREEHRSLLKIMNEGIMQVDNDNHILFVNKRFCEMVGYREKELLGKIAIDLLVDTDRNKVLNQIKKRKSGKTTQYEVRIRRKDGTYIWVYISGSPVFDENGKLTGSIGIHSDVTARRGAETALANQQRLLRMVIDNNPNLIFAKDWDGRFTIVNKAVADIYGTTIEQLVGKTDADFNSNKKEVKQFLRADRAVMRSQKPKIIPEEPVTSASGETRWFQTIKVPLTAEKGVIRQVLGVATDITDRRKAEEVIRRQEALRESELNMRQFLEHVNLVAISIDLKGKLIFINDYTLKITGRKRHEVLGKSWKTNFTPRGAKQDIFQAQKRHAKAGSQQTEMLTKDRARLMIRWNFSPLLDDKQRKIGFTAVGEDITAKDKAEKRLEVFTNLVYQSSDSIFIVDPKTSRILDVNDEACKNLGYSKEELLQTRIIDLQVILPTMKAWKKHAQNVIRNGYVILEGQQKQKDGGLFPGEVNVKHINLDGKDYFIAAVRDISERKEAESKIRVFNDLLNQSKDSIFIVDPADGKFLDVNEQASASLGYSKEQLLKLKVSDIQELLPTKKDWHKLSRNVKKKKFLLVDGIHKRKDGSRLAVEVSIKYITQDNRDYFLSIARDVTERNKAELEIRESNEKFKGIFESIQDVYFRTDQKGKYTIVSPSVYDVFGYKPEELVGQDLIKFYLNPADKTRLFKGLEETGRVNNFEVAVKKKNGKKIYVSANSQFLYGEKGKVIGIEGILRDVTEKRKSEEELIEATMLANRSAEAKVDFLANMSHELRTPMSGILGMVDLLMATDLDAEQKDFSETIRESTNNLLTLVNDVLDFASIDSGKVKLNPKTVILPNLLERLVSNYEKSAKKYVFLSYEIHKSVPDYIVLDEVRLMQVLSNLIENAIKFTSKGSIRIKVSSNQDLKLHFDVIDTGIGISKRDQARLFQKFTQIETSFSKQYKGTGLGLAICKQLVELMGGKINVESTRHKGSRFWFEIQAERAKGAFVAKKDGSKELAKFKGKILFVEDDPINQKVISKMIEKLGVTVSLADDGDQGLKRLEEQSFDLIILDNHMPGKTGLQVLKEMKKLKKKNLAPVIILSANVLRESQDELLAAGAQDYLTKPVSLGNLEDLLQNYLKKQDIAKKTVHRKEPVNKHLKQLFGKDYQKLIDDFLKQTLKQFSETQAHLTKKNYATAAESMHSIKGTSSTLGFKELATAAGKLEKSFKSGENGARSMKEFEIIFGKLTKELAAK